MSLALILTTLGAVGVLGYGYYVAVRKLNARAEERYGYRPITIGKCFVAATPYLLAAAGLLMADADPMNLWAGLVAALAVTPGLFIRIAAKSSPGVALAAILLLAVAGLGIGVAIVVFLLYGRRPAPTSAKQPR